MGGRDFCCIGGCNNRRSDVKIPFHKFPKKPESRRKSWANAAGRCLHGKDKFVVTEYTRVCGAHFVLGRKSNDPSHVDYIPTQNLPSPALTPYRPKPRKTSTSVKARTYSEAIDNGLKLKPTKYCARKKLVLSDIDINDVQMEVEISQTTSQPDAQEAMDTCQDFAIIMDHTSKTDHDYHKNWCEPNPTLQPQTTATQTDEKVVKIMVSSSVNTEEIQCTQKLTKAVQIDTFDSEEGSNLKEITIKHQKQAISSLKNKVTSLNKENNVLTKSLFCVENVLKTDDNVQFYTILPNLGTLNALFEFVKPKAEKLNFWRGKNTKKQRSEKVGPAQKLSLKNQFFATLVRLTLGLFLEDLSQRFSVSTGYFSRMFNTWVRFLRLELELLFPFPSRDDIHEHVPESFKNYPDTRIILDCTEIFIQKPSALKAQRETWSNYKHRNTHKVLVGITPDGTVSYVSPLCGGAASDQQIVKKSGILDFLEPGDNVMADRGFDIGDLLGERGVHLNIPPFRNGNFQLSAKQVEETRRIAEVRIHVERAIQRIKTFNILNGTILINLQMVAEDIFKTCSFLTNFQTPNIKKYD